MRHPAEVTADRIAGAERAYHARLSQEENDAARLLREALMEIARGER